MNPFIDYLIQSWPLILILVAFAIMLKVTIFLEKRTVIRMYILIGVLFLLSIAVFVEFYLGDIGQYQQARLAMSAIRYSATPIIIALILRTLVRRAKWYVLIPALALAVVNIVSIFTGIVFYINTNGELTRGVLGYLPYIAVGVYSVLLVFILVRQSNKQATEIIPIAFLAFTLGTGLVLPFVVGKEYSKIFCSTIAIGLFVYYVFLILQLTKKDALTGLLNRQAYYSSISGGKKEITAFVSIDMNGLKTINDNQGHLAGDEAIKTLANCFTGAARTKQSVYRIGGDEFVIVCRKTSEAELKELVEEIRQRVSQTKYSCSIGYCYDPSPAKDLEAMVKVSDEMMYADKADFYSKSNNNRRLR